MVDVIPSRAFRAELSTAMKQRAGGRRTRSATFCPMRWTHNHIRRFACTLPSGRTPDLQRGREPRAAVRGRAAGPGGGPGDVVAFQLPNWMEAAATFWAAALLGAVVVPIVHFYGRKELGYILNAAETQGIHHHRSVRSNETPPRSVWSTCRSSGSSGAISTTCSTTSRCRARSTPTRRSRH